MQQEYGVTYANLKFNNGENYANALQVYTRDVDNDHTSDENIKCMLIQVFTKDGVKISGFFDSCVDFNTFGFYGVELCETNEDNEFAYFYTNNQQNQIKFGFLNKNLSSLRSSGNISKAYQIKYMRARKGDQYIYVAYQVNNDLHITIIKLIGSNSFNKIYDFQIQGNIQSNLFTIQAYKNDHAVLLYKKGGNLFKSLIKPDGTHVESQVSGLLYSSISSNYIKNNSEFVDDGGLISVTISGSSSKIEIFTYDMDGNEVCFNSQTVSSYDFRYASFTLGSRYEIYIIAKYSGVSKIITANPMTCSVSNSNYHTNQMYTFGFLYTQSDKQQNIMLFGQGSVSGNYYKIFVGTVQSCTDYYTGSCSSCSGSNKSSSNGCKCQNGYYETSFTSCSECTTALRNNLRCQPNQCYSSSLCKECIGDQNQEYTRFLGTCDCPLGYYDDFPNEDNCQTCNTRCGDQGCDSATNCFNCVGIQNQPYSRIPNQACGCPDGFWDAPAILNCQSCNYRCGSQGCTTEFVCKNCIGTSGQSHSRVMNDCKCPVGYYDDYQNNSSNEDCLTCHPRCGDQGCNSATNCLNCVGVQGQVSSRIPNDSCRCPNGFWNDPNEIDCQQCNSRCGSQGCDSVINCLNCVGVQGQINSRIPNDSCKCPSGFWDDSNEIDCQSCDYRCGAQGCTSEFVCKNCIGTSGQSHSRVMNDCKCPVGYYDDYLNNSSNEDCLTCNIRCGNQGCDSATNCLNCVGVQGQVNSRIPNDSCRCPDGFWNDPTKEDCQPCDYRCGNLGCITEFDCKNCLGTNGQLYSRIMNDCLCPVGYYDNFPNNNNDKNCRACDYRCGNQGCNNNVQCINCIGSNGQSSSRELDKCLCPVGYYDDYQNNNDECQSCNIRCNSLGCDSATNCFGCVGIQNQVNSRIKTEACRCPDGFWDDPNELDCQPCDYRCGLSGCISEFVCKNCIGDTGQAYSRIMNNCHCPVKYYDDFQNNNSNENCLSCNSRCGSLGCDSAINCLNCVGIQNVECSRIPSQTCICPDGFWDDPAILDCQPCDYRCGNQGCVTQFDCKNCIGSTGQPYSRIMNDCICPIGFYDDYQNDNANEDCLSCNYRCGDQGCDSASNCFNCVGIQNVGYSRIPNDACTCPDGFWDDSNELDCQPCDYRCGPLGCITEFDCKNCLGTSGQLYSRIMSDCHCPVGYYDDYQNNNANEDCLTCNIRCGDQGCDSATNCFNCVGVQGQVNSRIPNDSCRCPDGFWNDPTKEDCQPCDYRCGSLGCITEFDCKDCIGTTGQLYSRIMSNCICPVGYYDDYLNNNDNEDCLSCDYKCGNMGCTSAVDCVNCIGSTGQFSSRELASCECPVGYYDDWNNTNNVECQKCDERCGDLGCLSADKCINCAGSQNRQYSKKGDMCDVCNNGFYNDYPNYIDCQKCPYKCGDYGCQDKDTCQGCREGYSMMNNQCVSCPPICSFCQNYFNIKNQRYQQNSDLLEQQIKCGCIIMVQ